MSAGKQLQGMPDQTRTISLMWVFVAMLVLLDWAIAFIDRAGRKPLLLAGSTGMALTLGVMALVFATAGVGADGRPVLTYGAAVTGLTAANLYIVAFGVSWGPAMWVLLGEMFPNRMRGAGCLWRHQLGGELRRDRHFPPLVQCRRSRWRLRTLYGGRRAVRALRVGCRTRDQREDTGGHVGRWL